MAEARALIAIALVGCRAAAPAPDPDRVEIARIVAEVEYLRQLPHTAPIVVHLVDEKTFRAATKSELVIDPDALDRERAWLTAFSMAPADVDLGREGEKQIAGIAAVYNFETKRLFVPKTRTFNATHLAHEVSHALVDQHFAFVANRGDDEATRAYVAFTEGDAVAAQVIYQNRALLESPSTVLWNVARARSTSEKELAGDAYVGWIPAYRDEILLNYDHGFRFVAALHRTGGFGLVNRAWAKPPTTTEQILHPEKYLAGELAIPIAPPPTPSGTTSVMASSTGEMGVRSVLSMCIDEPFAHAAASGWGGDAFRVVRLGDQQLALIWVTAWDDEPSAVRFETAMKDVTPCWDSALLRDANAKHPRLAKGTRVLREGARVLVLRGLETADAPFAGVGAKPALAPPLGPVKLVAFPAEDAPIASGKLEKGRFVFEDFGFAIDASDFDATIPDFPGVELSGPEKLSHLEVSILPGDDEEKLLAKYLKNLSKLGDQTAAVVDAGRGTLGTPLGVATEYRFFRGVLTIRARFLPICGGLRKIAFLSWSLGDQNGALVDAAIAGLSRAGTDPPSACR